MAARDASGSIRKCVLAGISFRVMSDSNATMPVSVWESSNVPTSGKNIRKMVRRSNNIEGLVLGCNEDEVALLKSLAESLTPITLAVGNAAGDMKRAQGSINIESLESEECRCAVQLLPEEDWSIAIAEF